jgi:hypothetical protein
MTQTIKNWRISMCDRIAFQFFPMTPTVKNNQCGGLFSLSHCAALIDKTIY